MGCVNEATELMVATEELDRRPSSERDSKVSRLASGHALRVCLCLFKADIRIVAKKQELSYAIETVVNDQIPALKHGHDGLIFTCAESSYVAGTDENM
jgi:hypothetical protein